MRLPVLYFAIAMALSSAARTTYSAESAIIPMPAQVELNEGKSLDFNKGVSVNAPASLDFEAEVLKSILKDRLDATCNNKGVAVNLKINPSLGNEAYEISSGNNVLDITGGDAAGVYYALMTLDQILIGDVPQTADGRIAAVRVKDSPRFPHRALMLDPARNFLPVDDVKRYIDRMSRYKFNVLQLHLTDDEGWRIEIESHPELTAVGAFRNSKPGAGAPDNGFYTRADMKKIIDYAAQRHIEIIPEMDIPGHTVALLAAHPEFGCKAAMPDSLIIGESHNLMLCAAQPEVYALLDDVISELSEIFPSRRIHLGGDESVIDRNWGKCSADSALMAQHGYKEAAQLMNVFFSRVLDSVRSHGKEAILWCELDNIYPPANEYLFNYPSDITLVTWRYGLTPKCIELTHKHGNTLLMAPGEYAYLDYPQLKGDLPEWNNWGMPVTTLRRTYEFDPGYGLAPDEQSHIGGVMATLWGEAISDINRASYMTYPRALAIAEAGWTPMERRDCNSFRERMWLNLADMMKAGVPLRAPFEASEVFDDNSSKPTAR